jgi:ABC-type Zn uptake system ZnuABC Zn-binding protein ZnuA
MVNAFVNTMVHEKQGNDKLHLKHTKNINRNKGTTTNSKQTGTKNDDHGNYLKIFHQNIRGIKGKI